MDPVLESQLLMNRRQFFGKTATGIGTMALGSLLNQSLFADEAKQSFPNFTPKARRIIYLFQSGAPSQIDLFDWKPEMRKTSAPSRDSSSFLMAALCSRRRRSGRAMSTR